MTHFRSAFIGSNDTQCVSIVRIEYFIYDIFFLASKSKDTNNRENRTTPILNFLAKSFRSLSFQPFGFPLCEERILHPHKTNNDTKLNEEILHFQFIKFLLLFLVWNYRRQTQPTSGYLMTLMDWWEFSNFLMRLWKIKTPVFF